MDTAEAVSILKSEVYTEIIRLSLASAAKNVNQLVANQFLDVCTSGLQILTRIEVIRMLVEVLPDSTGESQTQVGVDVDLADGQLCSLTQLILGNTDLRLAMTGTVRKYFDEHPDHFDPRQYLKPARNNIKELVRHKLVDVLGCAGKA